MRVLFHQQSRHAHAHSAPHINQGRMERWNGTEMHTDYIGQITAAAAMRTGGHLGSARRLGDARRVCLVRPLLGHRLHLRQRQDADVYGAASPHSGDNKAMLQLN